jgi:hypothetical protein
MRAARKLGCNTGHALDTERVPRPRRPFCQRVPYKSFVIIDLIEIATAHREGGFRLDSHFQKYFQHQGGVPNYADSRAYRTLRPILNDAGLSVALLRDRRSGKLCEYSKLCRLLRFPYCSNEAFSYRRVERVRTKAE